MMYVIAILFVISVPISRCERESRVVQTVQGPVRGYKDAVEDVFLFYGIPYATAPTGQERFKPPMPGPIWMTVFEATNKNIVCPQNVLTVIAYSPLTKFQIQEDCLIANVYTPNTNDKNLSVVVYIHGGAFENGFGLVVEPKKLVSTKKVIVVTFNYRLGIHGFLCLGTKDVPGNAGMKDQVALLRWVKNNIAGFGGNPNDVTIAGYSAGAFSAELLMVSPAAKGLFHKVVPESGGSLSSFAVQNDPILNAKIFARKYISDVDDINALEKFYKNAPFSTITSRNIDVNSTKHLFTPCVEKHDGENSFLNDSPYDILKSGKYDKLPLLYGFTDLEGTLLLAFFDLLKYLMNKNFSDFLPMDLKFRDDNEKKIIGNEVKEFYFGNESVSKKTILGYINYFSDALIIYPIMRAVDLHVKAGHNKVFLYEYSFFDANTPYVPYTNVKGASHTAQTAAVMDSANEANITEDYKKMKAIMRSLWSNFFKRGIPVPPESDLPKWPPTNTRGAPFMSLGRTVELHEHRPLCARMRFWARIYRKHYRKPQPPSALASLKNSVA